MLGIQDYARGSNSAPPDYQVDERLTHRMKQFLGLTPPSTRKVSRPQTTGDGQSQASQSTRKVSRPQTTGGGQSQASQSTRRRVQTTTAPGPQTHILYVPRYHLLYTGTNSITDVIQLFCRYVKNEYMKFFYDSSQSEYDSSQSENDSQSPGLRHEADKNICVRGFHKRQIDGHPIQWAFDVEIEFSPKFYKDVLDAGISPEQHFDGLVDDERVRFTPFLVKQRDDAKDTLMKRLHLVKKDVDQFKSKEWTQKPQSLLELQDMIVRIDWGYEPEPQMQASLGDIQRFVDAEKNKKLIQKY